MGLFAKKPIIDIDAIYSEDPLQKRESFFLFYSILMGIAAFLLLFASYRIMPTPAWLVEFDPLILNISIRSFDHDLHAPGVLGFGILIEFLRTVLMLLTLWFVAGRQVSIFGLRKMEKEEGVEIDNNAPCLAKVPSKLKLKTTAKFLWGGRWWQTPLLAVICVTTILGMSYFGLGVKNEKALESCYPRTEMISSFISIKSPDKDVPIKAEFQCDEDEFKVKSWPNYYAEYEGYWTLIDKFTADEKMDANYTPQGEPYRFYYFYAIINYVFILLVIIIHAYSYISTYSHAFRKYTDKKIENYSTIENSNEFLQTLKADHENLLTYIRSLVNPVGVLSLFIISIGLYEWLIGSLTLSDTARPMVFFTFLIVVIIALNIGSIIIELERISKYLSTKASLEADAEIKNKLSDWDQRYKLSALTKEAESMWIWRLLMWIFGRLGRVLKVFGS